MSHEHLSAWWGGWEGERMGVLSASKKKGMIKVVTTEKGRHVTMERSSWHHRVKERKQRTQRSRRLTMTSNERRWHPSPEFNWAHPTLLPISLCLSFLLSTSLFLIHSLAFSLTPLTFSSYGDSCARLGTWGALAPWIDPWSLSHSYLLLGSEVLLSSFERLEETMYQINK